MNDLPKLFNREMDRKEFLFYLGILFLTFTGISGALKNITNPQIFKTKINNSSVVEKKVFGGGAYGC